jgi:hypothetical protein
MKSKTYIIDTKEIEEIALKLEKHMECTLSTKERLALTALLSERSFPIVNEEPAFFKKQTAPNISKLAEALEEKLLSSEQDKSLIERDDWSFNVWSFAY